MEPVHTGRDPVQGEARAVEVDAGAWVETDLVLAPEAIASALPAELLSHIKQEHPVTMSPAQSVV